MKKRTIISLGVGLLVVALVTYGFIGGWLYAGVKRPSSAVSVSLRLCDDLVDRYNKVYSGKGDHDIYQEIDRLKKAVKSNDKNNEDPTCNFMLSWLSISSNDPELAKSTIKLVESAASNERFASPRLYNISHVDSLKRAVEATSIESSEPTEGVEELE